LNCNFRAVLKYIQQEFNAGELNVNATEQAIYRTKFSGVIFQQLNLKK